MSISAPIPTSTLVAFRPLVGDTREILVNSEQIHGRACVLCGAASRPVAAAGHVYANTGAGPASLGWPVVMCRVGCSGGAR